MANAGDSSGDNIITRKTPIFGQKLFVVVISTVVIVLAVFALFFLIFLRLKRRRNAVKRSSKLLPLVCNDTIDARDSDQVQSTKTDRAINRAFDQKQVVSEQNKVFMIDDVVKGSSGSNDSSTTRSESALSISTEGMGSFGWGRWYCLSELEIATNYFCGENVIGEGGYGVVYRGVLHDGSVVAVKNLRNNKGQAEKEFKVEVEAIGKVKHKNLVGLLGYCADGAQRLLVYEYIDNGNLEQWLHGGVGPVSPLTWEIRMKIAIGTARGLAYLHEGLEPKVVHRDVKSSNILLDRKWNSKVSDFGLAKLLLSEKSYVTTRVMGTFGYVSPDYATTGMLNEANDVYSFGVLLIEIITGRSPVDYSKPPGEMNLVDHFKAMVASRRGEELIDPLIEVPPPPRALKRILLVCLRCIDLDANKRPKMGQIVHMLEADEFSYRMEPQSVRHTAPLHPQAIGSMKTRSAMKNVVNGEEERPRWQ